MAFFPVNIVFEIDFLREMCIRDSVYDEVKARLIRDGYVDPVAAAPLIAASDEFHYNALANMREGLKRAQKAGTQIAIMSNRCV